MADNPIEDHHLEVAVGVAKYETDVSRDDAQKIVDAYRHVCSAQGATGTLTLASGSGQTTDVRWSAVTAVIVTPSGRH